MPRKRKLHTEPADTAPLHSLTTADQPAETWVQSTAATIAAGASIMTLDEVPLQRNPGRRADGSSTGVLTLIPPCWEVAVLDGPQLVNGGRWWRLRCQYADGREYEGWAAETAADGGAVLRTIRPDLMLDVLLPPGAQPPTGKFRIGQTVFVATFLNIRTTPGYVNKDESDIVDEAPYGAALTVVDGPRQADNLVWWRVRYAAAGRSVEGWAAEAGPSGKVLLSATAPPPPQAPTPAPVKTFRIGDAFFNAYNKPVNVRRSAGYVGKDEVDIVAKLPPDGAMTIVAGPEAADQLRWWQVRGAIEGQMVQGWMAEIGAKGERFMVPLQFKGQIRLSKPFAGSYRVTQLFGDRPEFYKQFSYDGVPLRGHNGVDFGAPVGTDVLATDDGEVVQVGYEARGFGYFVKLKHPWGESLYAHMKSVSVKEEAKVRRGDVLGPSGNTGNSSGPHLHFGIRILPFTRGDGWGGCCDPIPFMDPKDVIIPDHIRSPHAAVGQPPPGMAPDDPGRERP